MKQKQFGWLSMTLVALGFAGSALADPAPAPAPQTFPPVEPASGTTLTANITLASQYVSRGFQQTWGKPALQGGFDFAHPSGFFAGTWMSSVSPEYIQNGYMEWDLYAGYGGAVGDVSYKAQLYYYLYPGASMKPTTYTGFTRETKYNYGEILLGVTWKWFNINYWHTYTTDYFGYNSDTVFCNSVPDLGCAGSDLHSKGSGYFDANFTYDLGNGFGLLLHYGYERVKNFSKLNFADTKIGLTKTFDKGWSIGAAYTHMTKVYEPFYRTSPDPYPSLTGDGTASSPAEDQFFVTISRSF